MPAALRSGGARRPPGAVVGTAARVPAMRRHGISGCAARYSAEIRFTASPKIMSWWSTADRVFSSAANSSRLIPATNLWARCAACRISSTAASSRGIPRLGGVENFSATNPVCTALDGPAAHYIHPTPKQRGQFIAHPYAVEERPVCVISKGDKDIDVAIDTKIVSQHRAEQLQPRDPPAPAELGQGIGTAGDASLRSDDFAGCAHSRRLPRWPAGLKHLNRAGARNLRLQGVQFGHDPALFSDWER